MIQVKTTRLHQMGQFNVENNNEFSINLQPIKILVKKRCFRECCENKGKESLITHISTLSFHN